jgi:F0F1-type ATP synthase assembly protein I
MRAWQVESVSKQRKFSGMRFAGLGIEFAAAVAGLTLVGHWLDLKYGWYPWGILGGAALGLVGGMYNMIREALTAARPAEKDLNEAAEEGRETKRAEEREKRQEEAGP